MFSCQAMSTSEKSRLKPAFKTMSCTWILARTNLWKPLEANPMCSDSPKVQSKSLSLFMGKTLMLRARNAASALSSVAKVRYLLIPTIRSEHNRFSSRSTSPLFVIITITVSSQLPNVIACDASACLRSMSGVTRCLVQNALSGHAEASSIGTAHSHRQSSKGTVLAAATRSEALSASGAPSSSSGEAAGSGSWSGTGMGVPGSWSSAGALVACSTSWGSVDSASGAHWTSSEGVRSASGLSGESSGTAGASVMLSGWCAAGFPCRELAGSDTH
mmetsp:Transcript_29055/g.55792  ORF Transcript_29055/g.55792 Transcript_29055/m.55792 type:complete len:274 (-) Transcript_29055:200-1021(-)